MRPKRARPRPRSPPLARFLDHPAGQVDADDLSGPAPTALAASQRDEPGAARDVEQTLAGRKAAPGRAARPAPGASWPQPERLVVRCRVRSQP